MSKVLITGAGGYIGSIAAYQLLQKGYEIVGIDNFSNGFKQPLELLKEKFGEEKIRYYNFDIKDDLTPLFEKEKDINAVIHYAAFLSVDESMKKPEDYFTNNVAGSQNLFTYLLKNNIKKIIFSSTCAVYGNAEYVPIDEKHKTEPTNPYGASKVMVENILNWYDKLKGLKFVSLRYFNVCGASDDGLIGDSKKPSVHLMQNAIRGALDLEPFYLTFSEVDTPDKSPIRDYCNVVDLNDAHILALDYLIKGGKSEIINLGTGTGNSVLEIITKIEEETGKDIKLEKSSSREGEYAKAVASIQKAKNVLGWEPKRSIADSVKSLVEWYKAHPQGWKE
ncbi:UDP-glucose 4-epimerase GalE [Candidatus Roizmanbacteria bacterium RIFCSPHIGHO2_12_FULL_33_9]|uniref:UDP-glucose 4-epimerase n=1 Tax=Candidatus Roizmanbacteria bacterium RIFCSPHIGHO2_12_FULL_33_9 TaxID=1802045 RepID=A0A1F7HI75_9BACT|nr:MAG: UDP-glucose 4-epimerase GalE [Candidatus Roizmanbacteria bacterium RIFCSPHIGHO2_12_FULL_33_9]